MLACPMSFFGPECMLLFFKANCAKFVSFGPYCTILSFWFTVTFFLGGPECAILYFWPTVCHSILVAHSVPFFTFGAKSIYLSAEHSVPINIIYSCNYCTWTCTLALISIVALLENKICFNPFKYHSIPLKVRAQNSFH